MELKKSSKSNLENRRLLFFQIGLVLSLGIIFMAFHKGNEVNSFKQFEANTPGEIVDEWYTPPTNTPKPPPPPPRPVFSEKLLITDIDLGLEEPDIESSEIDETVLINALPAIISEEGKEEEDIVFTTVKDMPEFPGGDKGLLRWIANSIKYPQNAIEMGIDGTVFVKFVVNTDGTVINAEIVRGVDPLLDEEAVRVIKNMPRWKPGMQNGKLVKVMYVVPIRFELKKSI
ncbi:MAG: energy transducer TonB [Prolixibacteraceae bacterium]|nr:energy transducer TonB [Prolixibacteraceae bacterium]